MSEADMDLRRALLMETVEVVMPLATRLRSRMLERGLTRARTRCPRHPADAAPVYIWASLSGRRNHLHMACEDAACIVRFME